MFHLVLLCLLYCVSIVFLMSNFINLNLFSRRVESFKMPKDGVVEMTTNPNPNSAIK